MTTTSDDPGFRVLDAQTARALRDESREFAIDVLEGLAGTPKRLSSRWFYDHLGSEIFAQIMDVPQYYLTNSEYEILESHVAKICAPMAEKAFNLVDLGAGDGRKTLVLLRHLHAIGADVTYVPIDISEGAMADVVSRVQGEIPGLKVSGIVAEYTDGLRWLQAQDNVRPNLVLFLGSNIGNFNRPQSEAFLRRLWTALAPDDHVLLGFDLKKDIDLLLSAYNDPQGVTAAFNLNLLTRINTELGGNFDVSKWRHFGTFNVFSGAMESYLVSRERQDVTIDVIGQTFSFDAWEPIHTEYSYKYLDSDIEQRAAATGYAIENRFTDRRGWFVDSLWRVVRD